VPEVTPRLTVSAPKGPVCGVVLVLHGGRAASTAPVRSRQLAVLRMRPFAAALERAGRKGGLAVARLEYLLRGWNGAKQSPVADTRWALDELSRRFPGAPIAIVGHSMGGRTAVYVADHPAVRAVVALAPWLEAGDPVAPIAGRRLLVVHGDRDRITSPRASAAYARAAERVAQSVSYVAVTGEKHAMLRRASVWHRLTTEFVLAVICGKQPARTVRTDDVGQAIAGALGGEPAMVV